MAASLLIKNIGELVTCRSGAKWGPAMNDLHIVPATAVGMRDGIITEICSAAEVNAADYDKVLDAAGCCVLPGFIDSHTHFVFAGYRVDEYELRMRGDSYMEIMQHGGGIINSVKATRAATLDELVELGRERLRSMAAYGVTTVEGKSGYGLDTATELKQLQAMAELNMQQPIEIVPTFMGAHAVPTEYTGNTYGYVQYIIDEMLPVCSSLAEYCDVFCERNVFDVEQTRAILNAARQYKLAAKLHADEIVCLGGAQLAAETGAHSADHLLNASDTGIAALRAAGCVCTLLPATAFSLREHYARARHMIESGCCVALATDFNPGSCCTGSVPLVMALAAVNMNMSAAEIVTAFTINAARAVGREKLIGSIEIGKQADLVLLKYPSYKYLTYRLAENCVAATIKRGQLLHAAC